MAVFTPVSLDDLTEWIKIFPLGRILAVKGIASGIENSNFFITAETSESASAPVTEYVLTIFETLNFEQLPFYLHLMRHLAQRGVLVPEPIPNHQGDLITPLHGKPAAIVSKLEGAWETKPQPAHCTAVGVRLRVAEDASGYDALRTPQTRS